MEKVRLFIWYLFCLVIGTVIGYFLTGCKSTQKCDAYGAISVKGYDYVQVVGLTDTVPTFGEELLHLPQGEYEVKMWSETTAKTLRVKL
jgi:hypothetical protein